MTRQEEDHDRSAIEDIAIELHAVDYESGAVLGPWDAISDRTKDMYRIPAARAYRVMMPPAGTYQRASYELREALAALAQEVLIAFGLVYSPSRRMAGDNKPTIFEVWRAFRHRRKHYRPYPDPDHPIDATEEEIAAAALRVWQMLHGHAYQQLHQWDTEPQPERDRCFSIARSVILSIEGIRHHRRQSKQ